MAGRSDSLVIAVGVATGLVLGGVWLVWRSGDTPPPRPSIAGLSEGGTGVANAAGGGGPGATPPANPTPSDSLAGVDESVAHAEKEVEAASSAQPEGGLDGPAWRSSRLAFRLRELGTMGPYLRAGLDSARRDMEFCYRRASASAGAAPAPGNNQAADEEDLPPTAPPDPAILLLYIEARAGALDIVDARLEYGGTSSPEVVTCCRDVLRGLEIKAFGAVPGQRYRVKYRLPR